MATRPDELKKGLDRGQGNKVSFPDPAAAPLGTDEEAAGTPVPPSAVKTAADRELRHAPKRPPEGSEPSFWPGVLWIVAGALAVVALAWAVVS